MDPREPIHTGGPETGGAAQDGSRRAGAYGFSRREIVALLTVAIVAGGFGLMRWWQRATAPDTPPWVVESIIIDSEKPANGPRTRPDRGARSGVPSPTPIGGPIDVNTATQKELARLPGIGSVIAARIIASREKDGRFKDRRDLQRVNGIGSQKAGALGGWVVFSDSAMVDSGRAP